MELLDPHFSRKGSPWSAEEDRLLVKLKEKENLRAAEVIRRFNKSFPGKESRSHSGALEDKTQQAAVVASQMFIKN